MQATNVSGMTPSTIRINPSKPKPTLPGFQLGKSISALGETLFQMFMQTVIDNIEKDRKQLKSLAQGQTIVKPIDYQKEIDAACNAVDAQFKKAISEPTPLLKDLETKFGVTSRELTTTYLLAKTFAIQQSPKFFPGTIDTSKSDPEFKAAFQAPVSKFNLEFRKKCGGVVEVITEKFELSGEDKQFLKLKPENTLRDIEELDCIGYAFLKTRDAMGINWIKKGTDRRAFFDGDPIHFLKSYGYTIVKDPKEGDLVVYLNNASGKSAPMGKHIGIYQGNEIVESKMGLTEEAITRHKIQDVPGHYGRLVVFMRKAATPNNPPF